MKTHWEARFAHRTKKIMSSVIREILKFTQQPDIISFAGGLPAPDVFPIEEFTIASSKVLNEQGPLALQYSTTEGYNPLRDWIVANMAKQGLNIERENVIFTNGSQQGLDLLGKIFLNRGDKIIVEAPTYLGALQAWNSYGVEYVQVETDENGIIPEEFEKALRFGIKLAYILPSFQNPTGKTIPQDRRQKILEIADKHGIPIIEDDPYGQLRYEGKHIPSILCMDDKFRNPGGDVYNGNVIYLSTFSKLLAPGIRLAWTIGPKEVIQKLVYAKQGTDLHTSTLIQMVAYETAKDGFLEKHIEMIKETYSERRQVMLDSLEEHFPAGTSWTKPEGGLFLWVTLPEQINAEELLQVAIEKKVAFVPGSPFYPNGGGKNTLRLNFSFSNPDEIKEGVKRLAEAIKASL